MRQQAVEQKADRAAAARAAAGRLAVVACASPPARDVYRLADVPSDGHSSEQVREAVLTPELRGA